MKRLMILASLVIFSMGAVACTREKPAETPLAPQVGALTDQTPTPGTPGAATTPITPTTPIPAETPVITPTAVVTPTSAPAPTNTPVPPTSAPTAAPAPPSAPGTYTVQWGDTLTKIAQKTGVTTQQIVAANPGLNPNYIVPGQVLTIPAPGGEAPPPPGPAQPPPATCSPTYTVQRGDWFYALARRFGISVSALMAANPNINPNVVFPGQVLNVPCGGGTTPPSGGTPPGGNSYVVRTGDTLFAIALRFGTTVYAIQIANNLPNPNFIYAGQVLSIPH